MQHLTCVVFINLAHYYGKGPCHLCACIIDSRFCSYTSIFPRQMIVAFGLGTRLHVRMRATLENGVLRNGQQPQSVENGFYRPG